MERPKFAPLSLLALGISLFLGIQLCVYVASTVVVLPIWDDFDMGLKFFNKYTEADSLLGKAALVLEQHNEHRVVVTKLLVVMSHALFSSVDFAFLVWFSIVCLLGLVALLAVRGSFRMETLLIASAFLLQPQYGDGLTWAATSVSSFAVCFLALASGHLAFKQGRLFLLTFPTLALACFTQGNGVLLPLVISLVLALHRKWKRAFVVFAFGGMVLWAYFTGYAFSTHNKPIGEALAAYPLLLEYGSVLLGNSLGFSDPLWSLCGGIAVTISFGFLMFSRQGWANPALVVFALFLFLSAGLNTVTRGPSGVQFALSPGRYTVLSAGIVASSVILFFLSCRHTWQRLGVLSLALIFNYFSWIHFRYAAVELNVRAVNDFVLYMLFKDRGLTYPWPNFSLPIFEQSIAKGTFSVDYAVKDLQLARQAEIPQGLPAGSRERFKKDVSRVEVGDEVVVVEGWGFLKGCESSQTDVYVLLQGGDSRVSFKAAQKYRGDIRGRFKSADREKAGYIVMIPRRLLDRSVVYNLDTIFVCGGQSLVHDTRYRVDPAVIGRVKRQKGSAQS